MTLFSPAQCRLAAIFAALFALLAPARAFACALEMNAAMHAEADDAAYSAAIGAWGLCEEKAGHFAEAHRLVSRALEGAPAGSTPAGRAPRWAALYAAQRRLDDRVARVLVTWDAGDLYLDGKPVGGVSGRVMAVDPGRHLFEARKAGKALDAREIEVRAGDLPVVSLAAPKVADKVAPVAITAAPPTKPSPFAPALSPRGVAVGLAYAGAVTAIVSGVVAGILEAQRVSLRAGLPANACPTPDASARCAELRAVFEQSRGARNAAIGALSFAVVAGGVGVALHAAENKAQSTAVFTVWRTW